MNKHDGNELVAEDLRHLPAALGPAVSDEDLRRMSATLRRLLLDQVLQRAWNDVFPGERMMIPAPDLRDHLGSIDPSTVEFAAVGGANTEGGTVWGVVSGWEPSDDELEDPAVVMIPDPFPLERPLRLNEFVEQTCMIIRGQPIKRRHLVQYVANKLGGVHFDPSRSAKEVDFTLLDGVFQDVYVINRDAVFGELMATGQLLARAPDSVRFVARIVGQQSNATGE